MEANARMNSTETPKYRKMKTISDPNGFDTKSPQSNTIVKRKKKNKKNKQCGETNITTEDVTTNGESTVNKNIIQKKKHRSQIKQLQENESELETIEKSEEYISKLKVKKEKKRKHFKSDDIEQMDHQQKVKKFKKHEENESSHISVNCVIPLSGKKCCYFQD